MTNLHAIKPVRSEQAELIAKELPDAIAEAVKEGAIGYVMIVVTQDSMGCSTNLMAANIREVVGYIETDLKPLLIDLVNGAE